MPVHIYDYWYDEQNADTLTISYLYFLMQIWVKSEMTYITYKMIWT